MKNCVFGLLFTCIVSMTGSVAFAQPTRDEAYRSDALNVVVYKDDVDPNVLWYLPPLKLYEDNGKVVYYKRPGRDGKVSYYFYIVPYMTDDLIDLLAGELPSLQDKSQLKPVIARQFGIQVKQFNAAAMGEKITDYHYLNQPQLIKFDLDEQGADDFDFFVNNKPGIQANVLFEFDSERLDKYLNISLSSKEVYNALNIGATGKYTFTQAEISYAVENYLSQKYFNVKSKGDLPIPDIVNKVIQECFTPYQRTPQKNEGVKKGGDWQDLLGAVSARDRNAAYERQSSKLASLEIFEDVAERIAPDNDETKPSVKKGGGGDGGLGKLNPGDVQIKFTFKKELSNSDKQFYYQQQHYADSTEDAIVPVYLSAVPTDAKAKVLVTPLATKQFVVETGNGKTSPLSTGINVQPGQQYIVSASFAMQAVSAYDKRLQWYRWQAGWPNVDGTLYYRVGNGPWNKVNGRAVIKAEGIYHGELQFFLDREGVWGLIPGDYKNSSLLGTVPAIFTYQKTYPQFNVTVNGRAVQLAQ